MRPRESPRHKWHRSESPFTFARSQHDMVSYEAVENPKSVVSLTPFMLNNQCFASAGTDA